MFHGVIPAQAGIQTSEGLVTTYQLVIPAQAGIQTSEGLVTTYQFVIPAQAGIQTGLADVRQRRLDSRLRGNDGVDGIVLGVRGSPHPSDATSASISAGAFTAVAATSGAMRLARPVSTLPVPSS